MQLIYAYSGPCLWLQIPIWQRFMTYCIITLCSYITAHEKITEENFGLKKAWNGDLYLLRVSSQTKYRSDL